MENSDASQLEAEVKAAIAQLGISDLILNLNGLEQQSQESDFWKDSTAAQTVMQDIARLKKRIEPWTALLSSVSEINELNQLRDPKLASELAASLKDAQTKFSDLKRQLHFSGTYDDHGALLSIYAGAGGTDAQDWTQMLFRMY
ncbi:MAG: PCRF domain-containing protein, partial [Candidatus Saccharimonadales bacterium]